MPPADRRRTVASGFDCPFASRSRRAGMRAAISLARVAAGNALQSLGGQRRFDRGVRDPRSQPGRDAAILDGGSRRTGMKRR